MSPPLPSNSFSLGAVILAAGASQRMGRAKLLLPWGTTTVLGHLLAQWQTLNATQIAVVGAAGAEDLARELDRLQFPPANRVMNHAPERGMFSSIQSAARWPGWQPGLSHWAIVLGDQPQVRTTSLRLLLDRAAAHPGRICQPAYQARPRHPVLLPVNVFAQLAKAPDPDLRAFLQRAAPKSVLCELDDPGLDFDLDTPADYQRALRQFFSQPAAD